MISRKYEEIIKKLEEKINDKELLDFVKKEISELNLLYTENLENIIFKYENKIQKVEIKLENIEKSLSNLEKDFIEESQPLDLEPIVCPYCNFNFLIEYDSNKTEMRCPECDNLISLDWGEDEDL